MPACSWISWLQSELGEETALGTESAHPPRGHGTSCGIDVLSLRRNPRSPESLRSSEGMQPCSRSSPLTGAWSGQQSGMPFSSSLHGLTTLLFVPVEGWGGSLALLGCSGSYRTLQQLQRLRTECLRPGFASPSVLLPWW